MNDDDLEEELIDSEEEFDEFSQKSGLADVIRNSALAKIGVVVAVLGAVIGVMMFFSGSEEQANISSLPQGSEVTSAPGTGQEVDPAYIAAVEEQNEAELDRALAQGGSAIPVPIETPDTRLEVPAVEEEAEDPLHRWRMLQEERVERQLQSRDLEEEPVTVLDAEQQSQAVQALAESMAQQMESVLGRTTEQANFNTKTLITYSGEGAGGQQSGGQGESGNEAPFEEISEEIVIIPAGKIVYGQLLLEANSDMPTNVLAEMVSGPLKGWKLMGSFSVTGNDDLLAITFDLAVNDEGKQYNVNAVMLNPDTGLAAMRTDIDRRYFQRIIMPAAAEFISAYAQAVEDSGATSIVVSGDVVVEEEDETTDEQEVAAGVAAAGDEISTILDEMADVEVKVIIDAGTPIGIFFTQNVVETEEAI
ncbi:MAG: hypothetical protein ACLFU1_07820 [Alphaproteobacteria bacterium]